MQTTVSSIFNIAAASREAMQQNLVGCKDDSKRVKTNILLQKLGKDLPIAHILETKKSEIVGKFKEANTEPLKQSCEQLSHEPDSDPTGTERA